MSRDHRDDGGAPGPGPSGPPEPRATWTAVLVRALPGDRGPEVAAELAELYRTRHARSGRREADRWYRREVMAFLALVPLSAFGRRAGRRRRHVEERMGEVWRDVVKAVKSLRRAPGLTAMAVATLTLGIGANTVLFSVVDHVVLRPLPFDRPDGLVAVWDGMLGAEVDLVRERARTLSDVAAYRPTDGFNLTLDDGGIRVEGARMEPGLLPLLGVAPVLGRGFRPEEGEPGRDGVALLSHAFWTDRFGADPETVGRTLRVDGVPREIVGILPAGLSLPMEEQQVVLPLVLDAADAGGYWGTGGYRVVGRMAPGASATRVREDLLGVAEASRLANPLWTPNEGYRQDSPVRPLQDQLVGEVRGTLLMLLGAVGLVLLVACANVATLLLTRGLGRGREMAVRTALGAPRWRVVREQLIESLVLALAGCAVALLAAGWALRGVVAVLPPEVPRSGDIGLDLRVVAAGVVLAVLAGGLAGVIPALRGAAADPGTVLREGGRGGSASRGRRRITGGMVVAQMALAVVLVVGAGLLVRSLDALNEVDPGFEVAGLTTARLTLVGSEYEDADARYAFFRRVVERLEAVPGVASAAVGARAPFTAGVREEIATFVENVTDDPNELPLVGRYRVMPGFPRTLGLRVVAGRDLSDADGPDAPLVALVDRTMAETFWPGQDPVGRRIRYPWRGAPWIEVVGVVTPVKDVDLALAWAPSFYVPLAQAPSADASLVVRASDADASTAGVLRGVVREVDAGVPVSEVADMEVLIGSSLARVRWVAGLLGLFAGATLLLGCLGVYGVVAYTVRERTKEIGVRVALGAAPERIRGRVLRDGLSLTVPGTALGLLLAVPASGVLEGLLFGVSALDPVTFLVVPLVLTVAGVLAVYVPALRATRVDPVEALRSEA